jgi:CheY-like chemotaxis protein
VLLDLNLPKVSGPEILEFINTDPRLRRIPVVVLMTSAAEGDIVRTYDRHANGYVTKPVDVDRFLDVVRQIDDFYRRSSNCPVREMRRLGADDADE